jgi:two-component system alkaline phosphatase synthesis response regulator PhoP
MTASPPRILIIEDEPDMAMGLRDNLQFEGFEVIAAADGKAGLDRAVAEAPQLILLDVMLPKMNGFEVLSAIRSRGLRMPILMLTARGHELDKVRGLELGADDYITKPFSIAELLARIKAALRRSELNSAEPAAPDDVSIGKVTVSFARSKILRGRKELPMGHYESEILKHLLRHPGRVIERTFLLSEIWGLENEPMNRSVDNHVVSLRRKIEADPADPRHIITVHGFGYKFVP